MALRTLLIAAGAFLALCCCSPFSAADSPAGNSLDDSLTKLRRASATATAEARDTVDAQYKTLCDLVDKHGAAASRRGVEYLYALALIRQRRYSTACDTLARMIDATPKDMMTRRALIWSRLANREYLAALDASQAMADAIGSGDGGQQESRYQEAAGFLGRVVGYLEGPRAGAIDAGALAERKTKLAETLGTLRLAPFETDRKDVIGRYEQNIKEEQELAEEAIEEKLKKIDLELRTSSRQQETLDVKEKELNKKSSQLSNLRDELRKANLEVEQLREARRMLDDRATAIQSQAVALRGELNDNVRRTPVASNATAANAIANIDMQATQNRVNAGLAALNVEAVALTSKLSAAEAKRQALLAKLSIDDQSLNEESEDLRKTQSRVNRKEKVLQRQAKHNPSPRAAAVAARLVALRIYDDFPVEDEMDRMVTEIQAKEARKK